MKALIFIFLIAAVLEVLLVVLFGFDSEDGSRSPKSLMSYFLGFLQNAALVAVFAWLLNLI